MGWEEQGKERGGAKGRERSGATSYCVCVCVCVYTTSSEIVVGITLSFHLYACDVSSFLSSHPLP